MRLLFVSNLFPPDTRGGYEILCQQVRKILIERGHQVSVLTSQPPVRDLQFPSEVGKSPIWRKLQLETDFDLPAERSRNRRLDVSRFNAAQTQDIIQHWNPDLVFMWSQLRLSPGPARAAEASGKTVAYTMNDEHWTGFQPADPRGGIRGMVGALLDATRFRHGTSRGLQFQNVTVISQVLLDRIRDQGLALPDAKVIHQGVPLADFPCKEHPGKLNGPFKVIYAGQLHSYKGVHHVIEAVHILRKLRPDLDIEMQIAGSGPAEYESELRQQAEAGEGIVKFLGSISHAQLGEAYRNSDALVFPSVWAEPFGLTFLEAMASGTPVIATGHGGQGEVLIDKKNALLIPPEAPTSIASALERLIEDDELRLTLCREGRLLIEEQLNINAYVDRLEEFISNAKPSQEKAA